MKLIKKVFQIIWSFVSFFLFIQVALRLVKRYVKFPTPLFLGSVLDSDLRRFLQPPGQLIERSGIESGMVVLEIGPGSGAFTPYIARAVGEKGKVYCLDIQQAMLEKLEAKLARPEYKDIHNVELFNDSAYSLPFEFGSIDLVILVLTLNEIPDKEKALKEIMRVLKPGGILAISELLIDPDYPRMSTTARMGLQGGFTIEAMEGNLLTYTVRFKK
jgi:ubiquinone/menaquinone biosynthesis C-methylase UbiE